MRAKRGKSLFVLYAALAIASGRDWIAGRFPILRRPRVLYVAREDSGSRIQERIEDIIASWGVEQPGQVYFLIRPRLNLNDTDEVAQLSALCRELGVDVVVLDTWTALSPGADPLGAKDQTAQAVANLATDLDAGVWVVDHSRKNRPEGTVLSSADILGPSQKWQVAEQVLMMADTKTSGRIEVFVEGKDAETARFFLDVSPRGSKGAEKFTYGGTAEAAIQAGKRKAQRNCDLVLKAVQGAADKGTTAVELQAATGLSRPTVFRHLQALQATARVTGEDGGVYRAVASPGPVSSPA